MFLGNESLQYMISIFSHCNKKQTENPDHLKNSSWNKTIKAFVNSVGSRWAISPNPDMFPSDSLVHQQRLKEIHEHIISMDGVYTTAILENVRREQEKNARIAREAEENLRKEYEELKRREGEAIAKAKFEELKAEDEKKAKEKCEEEIKNLKKQVNELSSGGCFGLETQVKLESGRIIQMSELQTGDRVLSNIRNGIAEYSDVYLIAHIGQLRLTTTHYVFDEHLSIMFAKDLRSGETKILISDDNNKLVSIFVDDVTIELHDKYISFYTRAGSVIANGVLCSCYDQCPPSQMFMNLVFLPVRWWTYVIPSTHREERLYPYVQFLETVYLSFRNALKEANNLLRTRSRLSRGGAISLILV
ncbi:hypothetical protein RhiirA5_416345 [Rhizophagus irregularis]|uniref:Uncharacterized protein n=1 Tax=Rhizophagus irregularis TaxID=588596 RepID=A0A2I1F1H7_9GLOM|nr:hypothetical protein RhiirA5_416345 [Rhizophagus irregularis]PKY28221.1 hypothetical protein RhiirB3_444285 [Rhizophagus irregularis]